MNTREKGRKAEDRFVQAARKVWWRGNVEKPKLSGQLRDEGADVRIWGRDDFGKGFFGVEVKKGKQVKISTLLKWLGKDASNLLVLEPHGTNQQYIFMPREIWEEMVKEF